ncbi:MAG: tektin family protein [Bacteroidaceae bacterium]|nr:tektin family protein [Bacteroidaceae bacterium]
MDINSRINWQPGMEITAGTMRGMILTDDLRHRIALRAAFGAVRMGRLPGMPFACNGVFVKNRFEADHFRCVALLPSGRLIDADEDVTVDIPMLFGDRYYLTIGIANEQREYESEGVPYVTPRYVYGIHSQEEIEQDDLFPLVRFKAKDGLLSMDNDYIPPCLVLETDSCFKDYASKFTEQIDKLAHHPNLEEGEGKRALLHYLFLLKGYDMRGSVQGFVTLMQEIAQAIDYYVMSPHQEKAIEVPMVSYVDIQMWMQWLDNFFTGTATVLDGVVLEDNTIDYEALLAQAKSELYNSLHPELIEQLLADMKEELKTELQRQTESLTAYINETLKTELEKHLTDLLQEKGDQLDLELNDKIDKMSGELSKSLYEKMYFELFENLFNALYVPESEEEPFVPLI